VYMPRQKVNDPSKLSATGKRGGAVLKRPHPCRKPCAPAAPAASATRQEAATMQKAMTRGLINFYLLSFAFWSGAFWSGLAGAFESDL
jgi:hypothetical protein